MITNGQDIDVKASSRPLLVFTKGLEIADQKVVEGCLEGVLKASLADSLYRQAAFFHFPGMILKSRTCYPRRAFNQELTDGSPEVVSDAGTK